MRKFRTLAFLMVGLWLASCSVDMPAPPEPATSIKAIDQTVITAVQMSLKNDIELAPCIIQVAAHNDMVVLKGDVPSEQAKKRAEKIAKSVRGVDKVANHLEVKP